VLGAGASMPYGLPSGRQLVDRAIDRLSRNASAEFVVLRDLGHSSKAISNLVRALKFGAWHSIDALLSSHPEHMQVGKAAIAIGLLVPERTAPIFPPNQPKGCWYDQLVPHLVDRASGCDPISIITFNYDCTLERYLRRVAESRLVTNRRAAAIRRCRDEIIHVHGRLADPWSPNEPINICDAVGAASKSIIVLPEAMDSSPEFEAARTKLRLASDIYFLGFGFHPDNVHRLGLRSELGKDPFLHTRLHATRKGFEDREWRRAIKAGFGHDRYISAQKADVATLLRRQL